MKISMGSWAFSFGPYAESPLPLASIAEHLARAGYDGIELGGFPPQVTLDAFASAAERQSLRALLRDLGLGVSGYAADFSNVNPAVPGSHSRYVDLFRRQLELCVDLHSPMIRVDTVAAPGSVEEADYHAALYRIADIWRDCAELAREARVRIAWEFEPGFLFSKPSEVVAMHDRVGHPSFQILFDTCHAYMSATRGARHHQRKELLDGGVEEFIELLDQRIGAVHIVDSDGTLASGETSTHRALGEGSIVWDHVAPRLLALAHVEWWCVDLCFLPGAHLRIPESLAFARKLTKKSAAIPRGGGALTTG